MKGDYGTSNRTDEGDDLPIPLGHLRYSRRGRGAHRDMGGAATVAWRSFGNFRIPRRTAQMTNRRSSKARGDGFRNTVTQPKTRVGDSSTQSSGARCKVREH
jgi:hypothetical protein